MQFFWHYEFCDAWSAFIAAGRISAHCSDTGSLLSRVYIKRNDYAKWRHSGQASIYLVAQAPWMINCTLHVHVYIFEYI